MYHHQEKQSKATVHGTRVICHSSSSKPWKPSRLSPAQSTLNGSTTGCSAFLYQERYHDSDLLITVLLACQIICQAACQIACQMSELYAIALAGRTQSSQCRTITAHYVKKTSVCLTAMLCRYLVSCMCVCMCMCLCRYPLSCMCRFLVGCMCMCVCKYLLGCMCMCRCRYLVGCMCMCLVGFMCIQRGCVYAG